MLHNNADVRRCSYFELGLPLVQADCKRGQRLVLVFFLFSRCPYLLVEVFIKVSIQSILVMNLEEDSYMCLAALFDDSRILKWRREDILPHRDSFSLCIEQKRCARQKSFCSE